MPYIIWKCARDEDSNDPAVLPSYAEPVTDISEDDGCLFFTPINGVPSVADRADIARIAHSMAEVREYLGIKG